MKRSLAIVLTLTVWCSCLGTAAADQAADEAAIRKAVEAYVTAYNQQNAKALAELWSPDAVYSVGETGQQFAGREAIEKQFTAIFAADEGAKLAASTDSVQFISPTVAVETGTARLMRPEQDPEESQYSAVYVKRDGAWLLDRITEEEIPVTLSNYEHLKELQWMIGTWVDRDDQTTVETACQWTKNRNFMTRMFTVKSGDRIAVSGMQIVGWDPSAKQIRSWVFDSDGGFGQGVWSKKGNAWHVHVTGTAPDGSKAASVNIIEYVDNDTFTWQSVNRIAGGELLPNVDKVVVAREAGAE